MSTGRDRPDLGAWRRGAVIGAVVAVIVTALLSGPGGARHAASAATSLAGSQGTDAALPDDPASAVTKAAAPDGPWAGLTIHVNQTKNLVNQAITVKWAETTPRPTFSDPKTGEFTGPYNGNFVQIFQCWSADASTEPTPEQCEFGGESNKGPAAYPVDSSSSTHAFERVLADQNAFCDNPAAGVPAPNADCLSFAAATALAASDPSRAAPALGGALIDDPFLAVDGTSVPVVADLACCSGPPPWPPFDLNPKFDYSDTNEIDFARTYPDGTGQELFQADTGLEAPGLGCGQALYHGDTIPQCWLVVVPRGTPAQENALSGSRAYNPEVDTSPLVPSAWKHRIEFALSFQPVASGCSLDGSVRRITGDELAAPAVASWQPAVCGQPNAPAFTYTKLSDDNTRTQFGSGTGMWVMARPVDPTLVDPTNPAGYTPLTLSGMVIGLQIRRVPGLRAGKAVPDEVPFAGLPVTTLNLTPRLVAKLLTESYRGQLFQLPTPPPSGYGWLVRPDKTANPNTIVTDPDFLQFNPEFQLLDVAYGVEAGGLVAEEQSSDAAYELWQWIFADPEAKSWLDGNPDPWGMVVNPYYSTNAQLNPSGVAFGTDPSTGQPLADIPKSDPYCVAPSAHFSFAAPSICQQDWLPYQNTMRDAAIVTATANTGAKTGLNPYAELPATVWLAAGRQSVNQRFVMSAVDTADASRYGLQTAHLSQAGDDSAARAFIAPDPAGLRAGEQAMKDSGTAGVRVSDPATRAAGAYPLTLLSYAVTLPLSLDAAGRTDYGNFLAYATGAGQTPGTSVGALPPGYYPVSQVPRLAAQDQQTIATVRDPAALAPTTTTTTAAPPTTTTAVTPLATTAPRPLRAVTPPTSPAVAPPSTAPPVSTAPAAPVSAPATPTQTTTPARQRTAAASVGPVRFALPLGLLAGAVAMIGSVAFGRPRRRPTLTSS